ncbi:MAG: helix-turn-helix domain-containing protein [candidate division Zixibacteria bacterium]|nr:helix-turn-helix domain-containing protein [candidate division Zixibacteria bacterium]
MNGRGVRDSRSVGGGSQPGNGATAVGGQSPRIEMAPAGEIDITKDQLGAVLAARRHLLGLKIEEVAADIKVRAEYLRSLEQETLTKLPTPQYVRLFVKAYAERLGLNVSEVYALLDLSDQIPKKAPDIADAPAPAKLPVPPTKLSRRNWWIVGGGSAAVIVIIGLVLRFAVGSKRAETLPVVQTGSHLQTTAVPARTAESSPAESAPEPMQLTLTFTHDTKIVLMEDTDTLVNTLMHAGERSEARASNRFLLSLDNTNGVTAAVNGRPMRPLASFGPRLDGLLITADSVARWIPTSAESSGTEP